jgi:hypothetical protein
MKTIKNTYEIHNLEDMLQEEPKKKKIKMK